MNEIIVIKYIYLSDDANTFKSKIEPYFKDKFNESSRDNIIVKDLLDAGKLITFVRANSRYVKFKVHMRKAKNSSR